MKRVRKSEKWRNNMWQRENCLSIMQNKSRTVEIILSDKQTTNRREDNLALISFRSQES
jgi:hypothetical protein